MVPSNTILLIVYFVSLFVLALYGLHRYLLIYWYKKYKYASPKTVPIHEPFPKVTVQLPVYNEPFVVKRLIDNIVLLDYPKEQLEIQVLDDSTDETQAIAKWIVEKYAQSGINIKYIHRDNREGFKAGALHNGMAYASGEYIAIFDADFMPKPDFLKKMLPYFSEENIGMVQARWGHINRESSLLTRVQSIILDGHFLIEHTARNRSGRFFNFNGTAGIWRRKAIEESGGWDGTTLTEDMDLSYRAQMKGWKFVFVPEVEVPAELPECLNDFKAQQGRWAKGTIQTAKKLIPELLKSRLPLDVKFEAFFHLLSNCSYVFLFVTSLLLLPAILVRMDMPRNVFLLIDLPIFLLGAAAIAYFYYQSQKELGYSRWESSKYIPFLMSIGIGMTVNNMRVVIEGFMGKQSEFVRTPKIGGMPHKTTRTVRNSFISFIELAMAVYFSFLLYLVIKAHIYVAVPIILVFQFGFLYFSFLSFIQSSSK